MNINEIDKILKNLEKEISSEDERNNLLSVMKMYEGDEEVISSKDYLEAIQRLRGDTTILKLKSGLTGLDAITEGFWEGNVIIVSGPTKEGKTTFCQTLTINFTKQGYKCLWFPFDTPGDELISRFNEPVDFFLPRKNPSEKKVEWVEKKVIEGLAKHGTRVVFIDHLAMLTSSNHSLNRNYTTELQSIMIGLKEIAVKWRVVLFVNHHIRKIQSDTVPLLSDLKDSSAPAQDSDMTLMIWRTKQKKNGIIEHTNKAIVAVQASRRSGRTGSIKLIHAGDHFVEESIQASPTPEDVDIDLATL